MRSWTHMWKAEEDRAHESYTSHLQWDKVYCRAWEAMPRMRGTPRVDAVVFISMMFRQNTYTSLLVMCTVRPMGIFVKHSCDTGATFDSSRNML